MPGAWEGSLLEALAPSASRWTNLVYTRASQACEAKVWLLPGAGTARG